MQPTRRQGREFTEAVDRLAAGGVVFIPVSQTRQAGGDKNNGTEPTRTSNHPQERKNMEKQAQVHTNGGGESKSHIGSDEALGHIGELAKHFLGKQDKEEPVAKVTTVRTLGEKAVDTGLLTAAVVVGGTAVCAIGKYVFGIGRAPKMAPVVPTP